MKPCLHITNAICAFLFTNFSASAKRFFLKLTKILATITSFNHKVALHAVQKYHLKKLQLQNVATRSLSVQLKYHIIIQIKAKFKGQVISATILGFPAYL